MMYTYFLLGTLFLLGLVLLALCYRTRALVPHRYLERWILGIVFIGNQVVVMVTVTKETESKANVTIITHPPAYVTPGLSHHALTEWEG